MSLTGLSSSGSFTNDQYVGNAVDPTGLSFTATYDNGTTASVSPQALSPTTWGDTAGTQTCTFSYTEGEITKSTDVEATVLEVVATGITVSGTPATQRAFTATDATGLTVTATYNDGHNENVTSEIAGWDNSQNNTDTWGNCLVYDTDHWAYDGQTYTLDCSYGDFDASSSATRLHGTMSAGTATEVLNTAGEYVTLDTPSLSNIAEPWDGNDQNPGGYLIDGATAGTNAWMCFTKAQYTNDTPIVFMPASEPDGNSFLEIAGLMGPDIEGSSLVPAFGIYEDNSVLKTFAVTLNGTGTDDSEFVFVFGELGSAVDPAVGVKKSDFAAGYSTYEVKLVDSAP